MRRLAAFAILSAAACGDPAAPGPPPTFTSSPAAQWSGGSLTLRSAYLVGLTPLPIIRAAAETLALTRLNDSTVTTTLPLGSSGPVPLFLVRGTRVDSLGTVQRVGLREKRTVTPALYGELLATDSAGVPMVLGGSFTGTGNREPVVRLDVVPGQAQVLTLRQPSNTQYGMAPSAAAGVYAVRDSTDSLRLASLLNDTPAITGTVPWAGTGFTRQVSQLSPGIWLFTNSHQSYTRAEVDTCCPYRALVNAESPWAVYVSPRGDRTTLATVVSGTPGNEGVPVFDNLTGGVAFRLPLLSTEAATFSPDGATIYVAGGYQYGSDTLLAVDATTGALLLPKVALPIGFNAMGLAYRVAGDGQLLVGAANASSLVLLVYRASTLELLGTLPTADNCGLYPQTGPCFAGVVSLDEAHHKAYIVLPDAPSPIWTFDLLSGP